MAATGWHGHPASEQVPHGAKHDRLSSRKHGALSKAGPKGGWAFLPDTACASRQHDCSVLGTTRHTSLHGDCLATTATGRRSQHAGEHAAYVLQNTLKQARLYPQEMSPSKDSLTHFRSLSLFDGDLPIQAITAPNAKCQGEAVPITNRLSQVDLPNGMHTKYTYDASGRQDSIHHKDGATVKQGFDYTFDDGGQITRIDHEDGSYWAYDYDGRDRLVEAERYDSTPTLLHRYTYTYDDGDNMATKAVYDPSGPTTVTTTFTYNDANELTNTNDGTTSIDMTYDEWGRLTEKDDGAHTATYAYRYGSKLYSVISNFPGEGSVTYETGGDMKRRSRVAGANETWYNYTIGFDVVSTEADADGSTGALTMSNVVRSPMAQVSATLADLAGTTPSSGTARYYATDHLGSTRSAWDATKASVGTYEFTPYGSEYSHTGAALDSLAAAFTGKPWDDTAQLFHFPYRQYSPAIARWTTRDPLGMVDGPNVYGYVAGNPIMSTDLEGLARSSQLTKKMCRDACKQLYKKPKQQQQCIFLCGELGGSGCYCLEALCDHIGRHPSDFHKNAFKMCRIIYVELCLGK